MLKNYKTRFILVLVLIALSCYAIYPPDEKIKLGLDLKGGMHLVLEVKTDKVITNEIEQGAERARRLFAENKVTLAGARRENMQILLSGIPQSQFQAADKLIKDYFTNEYSSASSFEGGNVNIRLEMKTAVIKNLQRTTVESARNTLERRVDAYGVAEPTLQLFGSTETGESNQIIVELPGVENPEEVKSLLRSTAALELKLVHPQAPFATTRDAIVQSFGGQLPAGYEMVRFSGDYGEGKTPAGESYILVQSAPVITGAHLTGARASQDTNFGLARPAVSFNLNSEGARRFADATGSHIGQQLAIIIDNQAISAPRIDAKIEESGIITGINSTREAELLALSLRSGALPADIVILEERQIGPSLGLESISSGLHAGLLGLALIVLCMLVYYKQSGVNAILCLIVNLILLIGCMAGIGSTLTLPGIAGIILTIGMAVDSNVLIFERIREELGLGKTVTAAVQAGFSRAFMTIFDSNLTTFISAIFLYQFGTGPIRGFAVTLSFGLIANMIAAVFFSRALFDWLIRSFQIRKLSI